MYITILDIAFLTLTVPVFVVGCLVNTKSIEKHLPVAVVQGFRYGKFAYQGATSKIAGKIEVPKSWFKHFYIFGTIFSTFVTYVALDVYFLGGQPPTWLVKTMDVLNIWDRSVQVNAASTMIALLLITVHIYQRLYETAFVSVFSSAKMNLVQYSVGIFHYFGTLMACVMHSQGFIPSERKAVIDITGVSSADIVAILLFFWATYHQFKAASILAGLRKDATGKTVNYKYSIPRGDWFEYVSAPHYLAEVLVYIALTIILSHNQTWWFVLFWVVGNQIQVALMNHKWYKEKFEDYPANRKAIIPYIL